MRYGLITRVTETDDNITVTTEERIVESAVTKQHTTYTESVIVKNEAEALAAFLQLMDNHKASKVTDFGVRCYADVNGRIHRIEKLWKV